MFQRFSKFLRQQSSISDPTKKYRFLVSVLFTRKALIRCFVFSIETSSSSRSSVMLRVRVKSTRMLRMITFLNWG